MCLALLSGTCLSAPSLAQKGDVAALSVKIKELGRAGKYAEAVALAFRLEVAWTAVCAAVPLVLLAAQLPITPGGTGVREAAYVFFLGRVGVRKARSVC